MVGPAAAAESAAPVVEARREVVPGPEIGPVLVLGAPGPGQVDYAAFLAQWGARIRAAVGEELVAAGRSADDCPVLAHWLEWFGRAAPATAERFLRRWLGAGTPDAWGERAVAYAREGARQWVLDGSLRLPASPAEGPPVGEGAGGPGAPEPVVQGDGGQGEGADARAARRRLGAGRPLPGGVRGRMEAGLGRSLDGVRVHDDARGAELAAGFGAAAVTVGQDVAFAAGRFRPGSWAGDLLIAHELAHTVQQSAAGPARPRAALEAEADAAAVGAVLPGAARPPAPGGGLRVSACDLDFGPSYETDRATIDRAVQNRNGASAVAVHDFGRATAAERLAMLPLLLDYQHDSSVAMPGTAMLAAEGMVTAAIARLWEAFDDEGALVETIEANQALWDRSVRRAGADLASLPTIVELGADFRADVQAKALEHLDRYRDRLRGGLAAIGSSQGDPAQVAGPVDQAGALREAQLTATAILCTQAAMESLRTAQVGWRANITRISLVASSVSYDWAPNLFDPARRPEFDHTGARDAGPSMSIDLPGPVPAAARTGTPVDWDDVKAAWDHLVGVLAQLSVANPLIFSLVREAGPGGVSRLRAFAEADPTAAVGIAEASAATTLQSLAAARTQVAGDDPDLDPMDLQPVHQELYAGADSASGTDWSDPLNRWAAEQAVASFASAEFWTNLGLGALATIGFIVAEIATFGTATFFIAGGVGLTATGVMVGRSWERWDDLSTAGRAQTPTGGLVHRGQVDAAAFEAVLNTIFAAVDIATFGASAISRFRLARAASAGSAAAPPPGSAATPPSGSTAAPPSGSTVPNPPAATVPEPPAATVPESPAATVPEPPAATVPEPPSGSTVPEPPAGSTVPEPPAATVPEPPAPTPPTPAAPPRWTVPPGTTLAPEVTELRRFEDALGALDDLTLRDEILRSPALQRALVNEDYDVRRLVQAWTRWSARKPGQFTSASFEEYVTRRGDFVTASGAAHVNPALTDRFPTWGSMTFGQKTRALLQEAEPDLYAAITSGRGLPTPARDRVLLLLDDEAHAAGASLLNNATTLDGARRHLIGRITEELGATAANPRELTEIAALLRNSSNQGALGEAFAQARLADATVRGRTLLGQHFTPSDIPGLEGHAFLPDRIDTGLHRTMDVKTGYHDAAVDAAQARNYNRLRTASATPGALQTRVHGALTGHDYLFLPSISSTVTAFGQTAVASRIAAIRTWRMLEREGLLRTTRVFYADLDGVIHELVTETSSRVVGPSLSSIPP